ncbi:MAG: response regulator [Oleiphilaceae bacterium]|nr:response regulator [Oleiphilaceae bacterium]
MSSASTHAAASIDLREAQWQQGAAYDLSGPWDFFWQQWVTADSLALPTSQITVPGAWHLPNQAKSQDNSDITPLGYGTYRLTILLPVDHPGPFHLYMPDMASAYQLWVNGRLRGGNGTIATESSEERPAYLPRVYEIQPDAQGIVNLVIHTSNFHYQWGGIWYAPKITDDSGVFALREKPLIQAGVVGSLLLATGLLSLLMFLSRRQDKKVLFFSLLCFAIGLRRLLIDERVFYLFGLGDWSTLQALENLTIYLSLPFFLSYFYYLFIEDTPKWLIYSGWLIASPFVALALFTPVAFYTAFNVPFQLACGAIIPVVLWHYGKALKARRRGSRMFGVSLAVFVLAAVNDSLNYSYIIDTPNLMHVGALAFVLFQLSAMIRRYFSNFKTIEQMSQELSRRNLELEKLDSFKDEFLATTSHELRTPLHGIYGLAQRLRDNSDNMRSDQVHQVELIETTSQRLTALVNDILDFSSIKHGKLSLQTSTLNLPTLLNNTANTLRPLLHGKDVTLQLNIDSETDKVIADPHRIQQVLFNLLGNAIKFTSQGTIVLSTRHQNERVHICIQDTGSGLPDDLHDVLFEPFARGSNGDTPKQGAGLGLAITRQLLQLHGSDLELAAVPEGGTRACFSLAVCETSTTETSSTLQPDIAPLQKEGIAEQHAGITAHNETNKPALSTHQHSDGGKQFYVPYGEAARVFYADDEEVNRELVRSLLEQAGYKVETFADAHALIHRLEDTRPELILLDLMMPGLSGTQACRIIRQHYDHYELPIMMLTARYQISDIVEALGAGANDYLIKPYHEQELLARMFSQLSVTRLWQASAENERLQNEIAQKAILERELQCANKQLQSVLDKADESLLLLNEHGDIRHVNEAGRTQLGLTADPIETTDLSACLSQTLHRHFIKQVAAGKHEFTLTAELTGGTTFKLEVRRYEHDGTGYYAALIQDETQSRNKPEQLLGRLSEELAASRQRIEQIEAALSWATQSGSLQEASDSELAVAHTDVPCAKELVVKTLRTALLTWERYTHQTKADLAEKSRCWRVYIDGTTAKTRTLDKYLSVKTLPAKPRWRAVIKTANFVLDHCDLNEQDYQELNELVDAVDRAYS